MFFSHEVLTSRKYGVATIWLVATLGQKSNARKVSRKQILDVDIPKACESIGAPEVPIALRLQSSLLYGVSRVYSQQCDYVLADAQTAQNTMRALLRVVHGVNLDSNENETRPEKLLLEDDPAYEPNFGLAPLDNYLLNPILPIIDDSQLTSVLSLRTGSVRLSSQKGHSIGVLNLPSSQSVHIGGLVLPGGESASRGPRPSSLFTREEEEDPLLDLGFYFDADGEIHDLSTTDRGMSQPIVHFCSGGDANARVQQEHLACKTTNLAMMGGDQMDMDLAMIDYGYDLPPADVSITSDHNQPQGQLSSSIIQASINSAVAPLRRKARVPKVIKIDQNIELRNRELLAMNNKYLLNMASDQARAHALRAVHQAKKNAEYWLIGRGIGNVGQNIGRTKIRGPLANFFSGASLYLWVTGVQIEVASRKRESEGEGSTDTERRVRPRINDDGDQVGRGGVADLGQGYGIGFPIDDTELPREASETLEDISSAMPWNISASIRDSFIARGGQVGAPDSVTGFFGRRMISASPLVRRTRTGAIEPLGGADLSSDAATLRADFGDFGAELDQTEFECYGLGAAVDTQIAAQSSWQNTALDRESSNFLYFVENAVDEKRKAAQGLDLLPGDLIKVDFEELLDPAQNTIVVAARALLHVLTLGTKNLISVKQREAYGTIQLRPHQAL